MNKTVPFLLLALCACSLPETVWQKQGVSQEQYADDNDSCRQQVKDNSFNFGVGGAAGENKKAYYEKCMTDLGYSKAGEKDTSSRRNAPPNGILEPSQ